MELNSYKLMTIKSLINSAKKIMDSEGIDAITIRKVGELSRLNSATIYNYFESLEHLKVFVCLFVLEEYIEDIENYIDKNNDDILSNYYGIWECFVKHTMENVEAYYTIFFNNLSRKLSEYILEYYKIFPFVNRNYGPIIDEMLNNYSIEKRNILLLEEISRKGYIEKDNVDYINEISSFIYESVLREVYKGDLSKEDGEHKIKKYNFKILNEHITKNDI